MGMADELQKLGGSELLRAFANSFDLDDETMFEVKTDKDILIRLPVSQLRKILAGSPIWRNPTKGKVGKNEAGIALKEWKIVQ